jgi:protein ImuA
LRGGLDRRRVHELVPDGVFQLGATAGYACALAAISGVGTIVWIQQRLAALEAGIPYGPGSALFGIATSRWLIVETATVKDALWVMEESLRCPGVGVAVAEIADAGMAADLTATRRLNLVLQERRTLGLLLRHKPLAGTSACATRWRVAGAPGRDDGLGGLGSPAFSLTLEKNQRGPCGTWTVEWNSHDKCFRAALPVAMAAPVQYRPDHAA